MTDAIRWTQDDMIAATVEHWGINDLEAEDCEVVGDDTNGEPCLMVVHRLTGRTSTEVGDGGRWTPDGIAWGERDA